MRTWLRQAARAAAVAAAFTLLYLAFFAPVLLTSQVLAPGDAANLSMPHFHGSRSLWSPLLFCGFPVMADPQTMTWYPPAFLLAALPSSCAFNLFVLCAYVLASSFTYGYVREIGGTCLAAAAAGIVFGLSGFLVAHLGHTNVIHSAAWLPLLLWALERLRQRVTPAGIVVAAIAVAGTTLAGHPQFAVYGLTLAGCYVLSLGWHAPAGFWRSLAASAAGAALGLGLSAILVVPMLELTGQSLRTEMGPIEYFSYSLPLRQLPQLLFPYLFGGFWNPVTGASTVYFGQGSITETTGYVGLTPLLLAGCGVVLCGRQGVARFWAVTGIVTLLLALGQETPLAQLSYQVPIHNKFRIPARHFMECALAVAILAALGLGALVRLEPMVRRKVLGRAVVGIVLVVAAGLVLWGAGAATGVYARHMRRLARPILCGPPWQAITIVLPLAALLLGTASLWLWARRPTPFTAGLLLLVLVADLGVFGCFGKWRVPESRAAEVLAPPSRLAAYRDTLLATGQRLAPLVPCDYHWPEAAPPNRSRLWGVPSALGYCPLALKRYGELLDAHYAGVSSFAVLEPDNQALDVLAVRHVSLPASQPRPADTRRWHLAERLGRTILVENRRALPRAWLVHQVCRLEPAAILDAIRHSRLPDGRRFEPRQVALVEEAVDAPAGSPGPGDAAEVVSITDERVEVRTRSQAAAFLVLADVHYPGWQVTVNDRPAALVRTDYVLRGVSVPAGESTVIFEYRPWSFSAGAMVSSLSVIVAVVLLAIGIVGNGRSVSTL
jgi:hypothetical protein